VSLRSAFFATAAAGLGYLAMTGQLNLPGAAKMDPSEVLAIVNRVNAEMGYWHDAHDVLAVIAVESRFDRNAYRFEAKLNDASYGLMQVLSSTARDMGYAGPVEGLFDPETNIRVGMLYLRWVWNFLESRLGRPPTYDEWLSGYNGGVGNVLRGWRSAGYVQRFWTAYSGIAVG
jgi:hypothetical protein